MPIEVSAKLSRILAVFLALAGLALSTGGGWVFLAGGSSLYWIAGFAIFAYSVHLWFGRPETREATQEAS